MISASCNRRSEDIGVETVVIAKLKLGNVQRHIFCADLVERADYAALEDAPKAFNRVRVDRADYVLMFAVVNAGVRDAARQSIVAAPCVRREQANFIRDNLADEIVGRFRCDVLKNARNDVALALNGPDDRGLALRVVSFFIPVAVFVFTADECLIHFDNAAKFFHRLNERRADFVAHTVRRLIGAKAHLSLDLERRNSLFAGQHQMRDLEPLAERLVGVLKNRASDDGKAVARIASWSALRALPMPFASVQVIDRRIAATRAVNAVGPAAGLQIGAARILVPDWETGLKLTFRHLMDWFGTFCHGDYPVTSSVGGYCHA
jgi:hypothetical protein